MVFTDQPLGINGSPAHLLPVHVADQRLVARIFLAHAASLRVFSLFSRTKSARFLHSFFFESAGLDSASSKSLGDPITVVRIRDDSKANLVRSHRSFLMSRQPIRITWLS